MDGERELELVKVALEETGGKREHRGGNGNVSAETGAGDGADWFAGPAEAAKGRHS